MAYDEAAFVLCSGCGTEVKIENAYELPEWKYYCARCYAVLQEETQLEMWPPPCDLETTYNEPFYLLMTGDTPQTTQSRYANFRTDEDALKAAERLSEIGQCNAMAFKLAPLGTVIRDPSQRKENRP